MIAAENALTAAGISAFRRFEGYVFPLLGAYFEDSRTYMDAAIADYSAGAPEEVTVDLTYVDETTGVTAGDNAPTSGWGDSEYEAFASASVIPRIREFFDL